MMMAIQIAHRASALFAVAAAASILILGGRPAAGQTTLAFPVGDPAAPAGGARSRNIISFPGSSSTRSRAVIIAQREYEREIRRIRAQYLGSKKFEPDRTRGMNELARFTDPMAIEPLLDVLRNEQDDVRNWLLDHIASQIDPEYAQATLAYLSIYDEDEWWREAARERLDREAANDRAKWVVGASLKSSNHEIVNHAALSAGQMKLVEAIPLLINAQVQSSASTRGSGDLAFIQVGTTRFFVSDLQPVVGESSAGFDPTLSPLREGTVMAIEDAVVEFYRVPAHNALVDLVHDDFGRRIDFGYNTEEWNRWFHETYAPFKAAQKAPASEG